MKKEIEIKIGNVFSVKRISENKEVDGWVKPLFVYSTNKKDCIIVVQQYGASFLFEHQVYRLMQQYSETLNCQVKFIYFVSLSEEYKGESEVQRVERYGKNSRVTIWDNGVYYDGHQNIDFRLPKVNGWQFRVGEFTLKSANEIIAKYKEENKEQLEREAERNRILDEQLTQAANS